MISLTKHDPHAYASTQDPTLCQLFQQANRDNMLCALMGCQYLITLGLEERVAELEAELAHVKQHSAATLASLKAQHDKVR